MTRGPQRPPNVPALFLAMLILMGLCGSGLWYLTSSFAWAIPGGVILGAAAYVALYAWSNRDRDGCFPRERGPHP